MNNFKEIAEKCLKGELSGTFILRNGGRIYSSLLDVTGNKYLPYRLHGFFYHLNGNYLSLDPSPMDIINFIPDMEERNVKLTLEKAKEWYKKGGELKEVALQAYKEEELKSSYPKSWEEYCEQMKRKEGWFIDTDSSINYFDYMSDLLGDPTNNRNLLPTKELAEAFLAYMQLISLRKAWIGKWKPNWNDAEEDKYIIYLEKDNLKIDCYIYTNSPLSFPTKEMCQEFMNCFQDLLKKAKGLY